MRVVILDGGPAGLYTALLLERASPSHDVTVIERNRAKTPYRRRDPRAPTIAVGNVTEPDQVNAIVAAGRADLMALGRPHLADPYRTLHGAAALGDRGIAWPPQYDLGRVQPEREAQRKRTTP